MSLTEVYDIKSNVLHQNQILYAPVVILIISDCDLSCPYAQSAGISGLYIPTLIVIETDDLEKVGIHLNSLPCIKDRCM